MARLYLSPFLNPFASPLFQMNAMQFSAKTRKIAAKKLSKRRVTKYKLKTKKALQRRLRVVSILLFEIT